MSLSLLQLINLPISGVRQDIPFLGVCGSFEMSSLVAELELSNETSVALTISPEFGLECAGQNSDIDGIIKAPVTIITNSDNFTFDIPNAFDFDLVCDGIELVEADSGADFSFLAVGACNAVRDTIIADLVATSVAPSVNALFSDAAAIRGPIIEEQTLEDVVQKVSTIIAGNDFDLLSEEIVTELATETMEKFSEVELLEPLIGAIESGDFNGVFAILTDIFNGNAEVRSFFRKGKSNLQDTISSSSEKAGRSLQDAEADGIIALLSQLEGLVDPIFVELFEAFLSGQFDDLSLVSFATTLGITNEVFLQGIQEIFGNQTIGELFENDDFGILLDLPIISFINAFLPDVDVQLSENLQDASLNDIFGFLEIPIVDLVFLFFGENEIADVLNGVIDPELTVLDLSSLFLLFFAIILDESVNLIVIDQEVLDIVFEDDVVPDSGFDQVLGIFSFILQSIGNLDLNFDESFGENELALFTVLASFGVISEEDLDRLEDGLTVSEFLRLPQLSFPLGFQNIIFTVEPSQFRLKSAAAFSLESTSSAMFNLPRFEISEFDLFVSIVVAFSGAIRAESEISFEVSSSVILESFINPIANIEALRDIGLFNIQETDDIAGVLSDAAICGASNMGVAFGILPTIEADIGFGFSNEEDQGIQTILNTLVQDMFGNFLPVFLSNSVRILEFQAIGSDFIELTDECTETSIAASNEGGGANTGIVVAIVLVLLVVVGLVVAFFASKGNGNSKSSYAAAAVVDDEKKEVRNGPIVQAVVSG